MFGFGKSKGASNRTWVLFLTTIFLFGVAQSTEGGIGGSARRGVTSLNGLRGTVTLSAGTGITLTPTGNDIEIASTTTGDVESVGDCPGPDCFTPASPDAALTFDNATSGTVTLQTVAGALGTNTVSLPAETGTIFTDAATIPVANGGTNVTTSPDDNVLVGSGVTWVNSTIPDCDLSNDALNYDTTTNAFSCQNIAVGTGTITAVGPLCASGDCFVDGTNDTLLFEGTTVDAIETTFGATDPTIGDQTINLPDFAAAGTFILAGDATSVTNLDGTGLSIAAGTLSADLGTSIDLTTEVTGTLPVANGGTGATTLTDGGIVLGSGVGAVTVLAQATNGQIPIGSTGSDPVLATISGVTDETDVAVGAGTITIGIVDPLIVGKGGIGVATLTDGGPLLGSGTAAITALAQPTNGQLIIGSTGGDPVLATLTEGAGVTITEGAGTITIAATAAASGRVQRTAGNVTTTSTTLVDFTGATVTFTTGANPVMVGWVASCDQSVSDEFVRFNIDIDGTDQLGTDGITFQLIGSNDERNCSFTWLSPDLTAASHTIKLEWLVGSGTGRVICTTAVGCTFWAAELN